MCVFNKEQMFQLFSDSESRLIERMDVGSGKHESQVIINQIKVHSNALKFLHLGNLCKKKNLLKQSHVAKLHSDNIRILRPLQS